MWPFKSQGLKKKYPCLNTIKIGWKTKAYNLNLNILVSRFFLLSEVDYSARLFLSTALLFLFSSSKQIIAEINKMLKRLGWNLYMCVSLTPVWRASDLFWHLSAFVEVAGTWTCVLQQYQEQCTCGIICLCTHYRPLCFMRYSQRGPINLHWCCCIFKVKYIEVKIHIPFTFSSSVTNAVTWPLPYSNLNITSTTEMLFGLLVVVPRLWGNR